MTELRLSGVTPYRRMITEGFIDAFRDVFDNAYNRDQQLVDLRVTQTYPLQKIDYPTLVINYSDQRVSNVGVGHEEWFDDINGVYRKWYHSRFEGSLELELYALTPLDRDLLADAVVDVLRFGRLDPELTKFFTDIYGDPTAEVSFQVDQLVINTDEIMGRGNTSAIAPWAPEDQLVYSTAYSVEIQGGFYNTTITDTYEFVSDVEVYEYPQGEVQVIIPDTNEPFTNPFVYFERQLISGKGKISEVETDVDVDSYGYSIYGEGIYGTKL